MKRPALIALVILIAAAIAGSYYYMHYKKQQQAAQAPAANAPAAAEEAAPEEVDIPVEKQQLMGVKIVNATKADFTHTIRTVGRLDYDETRLATVTTKVEGWLDRLYANTTGMYIRKGGRVADLYSPELIATEREYLSALKWADEASSKNDEPMKADAGRMVEAARQRLALWDISEADIDRLTKERTPQRTFSVYSPVSGVVVARAAVQGSRVMPGEKIVDVAELSTLWALADVYEFELANIRPGMPAELTLTSYPGRVFHSKVDFIYPVLSTQTRTAKVRLVLPNPRGDLRPEMYANVEIRVPLGPRLSVPSDAVIDTGVRNVVFVDKGEGQFEPREVTTGIEAGDRVEIINGLTEGEPVAAAGAFLIDSEAKLRGVEK